MCSSSSSTRCACSGAAGLSLCLPLLLALAQSYCCVSSEACLWVLVCDHPDETIVKSAILPCAVRDPPRERSRHARRTSASPEAGFVPLEPPSGFHVDSLFGCHGGQAVAAARTECSLLAYFELLQHDDGCGFCAVLTSAARKLFHFISRTHAALPPLLAPAQPWTTADAIEN